MFRGKTLEVKIVHSTVNGTRVVGVPAEILYNKWNNLALRFILLYNYRFGF